MDLDTMVRRCCFRIDDTVDVNHICASSIDTCCNTRPTTRLSWSGVQPRGMLCPNIYEVECGSLAQSGFYHWLLQSRTKEDLVRLTAQWSNQNPSP
jgi:hypothetical protein